MKGKLMKAIVITQLNQGMLGNRFQVEYEDFNDLLPIGYILVTDFGNDENFDVLTQESFDSQFDKVADIQNGFMAISRK